MSLADSTLLIVASLTTGRAWKRILDGPTRVIGFELSSGLRVGQGLSLHFTGNLVDLHLHGQIEVVSFLEPVY